MHMPASGNSGMFDSVGYVNYKAKSQADILFFLSGLLKIRSAQLVNNRYA